MASPVITLAGLADADPVIATRDADSDADRFDLLAALVLAECWRDSLRRGRLRDIATAAEACAHRARKAASRG